MTHEGFTETEAAANAGELPMLVYGDDDYEEEAGGESEGSGDDDQSASSQTNELLGDMIETMAKLSARVDAQDAKIYEKVTKAKEGTDAMGRALKAAFFAGVKAYNAPFKSDTGEGASDPSAPDGTTDSASGGAAPIDPENATMTLFLQQLFKFI
jgi:hypothetical protein